MSFARGTDRTKELQRENERQHANPHAPRTYLEEAVPTLTRGYGDPSARESRRESSSSPMMSPSVKSSVFSGTGKGTQSGDGSKLAAGSEVGKPFASESEGREASPSLTGMEAAIGAGRHCRSTEQSVTRKKQSRSPGEPLAGGKQSMTRQNQYCTTPSNHKNQAC